MIEASIAVALSLSGLGLLLPWWGRLSRPAIGWLAFPIGSAVYLVVSLGLLASAGRLDPIAALIATMATGVGGAIVALRRRVVDGGAARLVGMVAIATFGIALFAWLMPLARLTIDSGEYLLGAQQVQMEGAMDLLRPFLLKRQIGYQALHALAVSDLRAHVAFVGPLFGVAGLGLVLWFGWTRVSGDRRRRLLVVGGAAALLLSSNRLTYDFFYIHPHIQMATYLFIAVLGTWLAVVERENAWALPAGLSLAALLLLRPESPLLVVAVLVPAAASAADRITRRFLAIPPLAVMIVWYGFILWRQAPDGDAVGLTEPVFSSLGVVIAACTFVLLLDRERTPALSRFVGVAMLPALVLVLAVYAVDDFIILRDSVVATFRNLKRLGWWVATWAVIVPVLAVGLVTHRVRRGELWTRPIVAFGLLFFLFPYLRGSAWRVGPGDSGNRMLAHFLFVVVAFILVAFADPGEDTDEPTG